MPSHGLTEAFAGPPAHETPSEDGDPDSSHSASEFSSFRPSQVDLRFLEPITDRRIWSAASDLATQGYAHVSPDVLDKTELHDWHRFVRAFEFEQDPDPEPGRRWRSYSAFEFAGNALTLLPPSPYLQTKQYNPEDGDKLRRFRSIDPDILASATLRELIRFNLAVARLTDHDLVEAPSITVGVHMIAYRPGRDAIAFSSPIWLHRDQEPYVAVVMCGASSNLEGGMNILSSGEREIQAMITLDEPLEMLLLSRMGKHAVVPMKSADGRPAHRNVTLITFAPVRAA